MKCARSLLLAAVAGAVVGCGSSPTEPASSSARTTLRIVVHQCDLGGSVVVRADDGTNGTLMTPGELTLMLTPGPHSVSYQRGNEVFGGSVSTSGGTIDPLHAIPPGSTASIALVDPPGACTAVAH